MPSVLNTNVYDEILPIKNEDAFDAGREIAVKEGILVGISSGAALAAAVQLARREENAGKQSVALLPDSGDRYLSTENVLSGVNKLEKVKNRCSISKKNRQNALPAVLLLKVDFCAITRT